MTYTGQRVQLTVGMLVTIKQNAKKFHTQPLVGNTCGPPLCGCVAESGSHTVDWLRICLVQKAKGEDKARLEQTETLTPVTNMCSKLSSTPKLTRKILARAEAKREPTKGIDLQPCKNTALLKFLEKHDLCRTNLIAGHRGTLTFQQWVILPMSWGNGATSIVRKCLCAFAEFSKLRLSRRSMLMSRLDLLAIPKRRHVFVTGQRKKRFSKIDLKQHTLK